MTREAFQCRLVQVVEHRAHACPKQALETGGRAPYWMCQCAWPDKRYEFLGMIVLCRCVYLHVKSGESVRNEERLWRGPKPIETVRLSLLLQPFSCADKWLIITSVFVSKLVGRVENGPHEGHRFVFVCDWHFKLSAPFRCSSLQKTVTAGGITETTFPLSFILCHQAVVTRPPGIRHNQSLSLACVGISRCNHGLACMCGSGSHRLTSTFQIIPSEALIFRFR